MIRWALGLLLVLIVPAGVVRADTPRPNVLVILTDDQGYGDLGRHGNPILKTPRLDALAKQSTELTAFWAAPVCAPTRASLLTGRSNYRTRVVDTYLGRALMDPDEVTLAEVLRDAGYRTGLFGKWHLGDNAPMRPQDQGFAEVLVHRGGGIGQASDPPEPGGSSYTDPWLLHNGRLERASGYCSDIFADAAVRFIEADRSRPFFAMLAFNAPHTPLQVPDAERLAYAEADFASGSLPAVGRAVEGRIDPDTTARVYGMITHLDRAIGRVLDQLETLDIADQTLVVFLTDNGPQQPRYNAGLRGLKGTTYEGGIRVPCFVRWPGRVAADRTVETPAALIDLMPTLLDACGLDAPAGVTLDGRSLWPLLTGGVMPPGLADRTLCVQWHRGDVPELGRAFAARQGRWKLVQPRGTEEGPGPVDAPRELYDLVADPFEQHDLAAEHPEVLARLGAAYEAWFRAVTTERGVEPPRILLGIPDEQPSILTRQDWRGPRAGWSRTSLGHWEVRVAARGRFRVRARFEPTGIAGARLRLRLGDHEQFLALTPEATTATFADLTLDPGPTRLEVALIGDGAEVMAGARSVEVERRDSD